MVTSNNLHRRRLAYAGVIALLNVAGFFYYFQYLTANGYLPTPFVYDKSDTFMDLFNPLYWAYDAGRYTDWGSVYPPLGFFILRLVNFVFAGGGYGDAALMRDDSPFVIAGFCLVYFAVPVMILKTRLWRDFPIAEKSLIYVAIVLSAPMLFALERGNLVILCPVLLALVLSRVGFVRCLCIAVLINIKPYFALLMIYYMARKNWKAFAVCTALSGLIFAVSGLALDDNFFVFFKNLLNFSQEDAVFSLREVMSMPSSVSAFSYVLKNPDGAGFASRFLNPEQIANVIFVVEAAKWSVIAISLATLISRSSAMRDAEIFVLLVVIITNLGIWVGGYSLILYAALIPVFIRMRARWLYIGLLTAMAMPLDVIPLMTQFIGDQYPYFADSYIEIRWTLGLGSLIRPAANLILLALLTLELLTRKQKSRHQKNVPHASFPFLGHGLERST